MTVYRTADGLPGLALREWSEAALRGMTMTDRDARLATRIASLPADARLDVRAGDGGITVRTTGAVGVVRFSGFEIRIDPKLPGDHLQLFRLIEFVNGLDGLVQLVGEPHIKIAGASLLDLVVDVLSSATERILAAGPRADYVEREGDLPALRGRLLLDRQQLERFGLYDRVVCRYDEHEFDIPDNQLLALALARGARIATLARVRRRARGLAAVLEDLCDPDSLDQASGPNGFAYSRHNQHYRNAHTLSWMVLRNAGLDESLTSGPARLRSFLIDMGALFERFVERLLRQALLSKNVAIAAQRSDAVVWRANGRGAYAYARPDLLLQPSGQPERQLPVDAKYKPYDKRAVGLDDLAQIFLYAQAYHEAAETAPAAILIHPSELPGQPRTTNLEVRSLRGHVQARLSVVAVHIPTLLDEADAGGGPGLAALAGLVDTELARDSSRRTTAGPTAALDV